MFNRSCTWQESVASERIKSVDDTPNRIQIRELDSCCDIVTFTGAALCTKERVFWSKWSLKEMARIETQQWKLARQWMIERGVIPPIHPATKPSADLVDFARCLRDGVYLCVTLNKIKPNCVQFTARPTMQVLQLILVCGVAIVLFKR